MLAFGLRAGRDSATAMISRLRLIRSGVNLAEVGSLKGVGMVFQQFNPFPPQNRGRKHHHREIACDGPHLMLFDEPTSALDPEMIGEVLDVMRELAADCMTMMIVTHEMGFARKVAARIIYIDRASTLETGKPDEFFANPKNDRVRSFLARVLKH